MTIANGLASVTYAGNGATTVWPYGFWVPYRSDGATPAVSVILTDSRGNNTILDPTAYTISGVDSPNGGTVVYPLAANSYVQLGWKLTILRNMSYDQPTTVPNQSFYPKTVENVADYLSAQIAQLKVKVDRALLFPTPESGQTSVSSYFRAKKFLAADINGDIVWSPAIGGDDIVDFFSARLYWDYNGSMQPRLVIDPDGLALAPIANQNNPNGKTYSSLAFQTDIPFVESSGSQVWFSSVWRNWSGSDNRPRSKRSRSEVTITAMSEIEAPYWEADPPPYPTDVDYADYLHVVSIGGTWGVIPDSGTQPTLYAAYLAWIGAGHSWGDTDTFPRYLPQEVGGLSVTSVGAAGKTLLKIEGAVISARAQPTIYAADGTTVLAQAMPMKLVGAQIICVQAVKGPAFNRKQLITQDDDDDDGADFPGAIPGSFILRLNGGTTSTTGVLYRSWCAILAGGRAGIGNGIVFGKTKGTELDGDGIVGHGGLKGGRSFWHQDTMAISANNGFMWLGWDGVTPNGDGTYSDNYRAVIDIKTPDGWTGPIIMVDDVEWGGGGGGGAATSLQLTSPDGTVWNVTIGNDGGLDTNPA